MAINEKLFEDYAAQRQKSLHYFERAGRVLGGKAGPNRLKGMPPGLITEYQRHLRYYGVDLMSSTGGVLSSVHTERDIEEATVAFEKTVVSLRDLGMVLGLG
jgi:hypothetical protein